MFLFFPLAVVQESRRGSLLEIVEVGIFFKTHLVLKKLANVIYQQLVINFKERRRNKLARGL